MSRPACSVTPVTNPDRDQQAAGHPLDAALDGALARLDGLDAVGVHEHVEVYAAVDAALRARLAGTEG